MYEFVRELKNLYKPEKKKSSQDKPQKLTRSLEYNIGYIRRLFGDASDLTIHEIKLNGTDAAVISIDNLISKDTLAFSVLKPILSYSFGSSPEDNLNTICEKVLYTDDITKVTTFDEVSRFILSGFCIIAVEGSATMLSVGIQGFKSRSISEPESDVIQRGSKEGFVEAIHTNMSMLRRRMKTPGLMLELSAIGKLTGTEICICYLADRAEPSIVRELKRRLNCIDIDTVLAAGYLVPYIEDNDSISPFSTVGITERPDTVCGKMSEGRIAILIDGVPSALIVPYLFAEYFQTLDDYSNRPYFATFTRWLKFAAFFLSILLPGVFVALCTFDQEMFPSLMLNKIAGAVASTPLSLMGEMIIIQFIYEIMRESGLRMPQPLGYAVSIVGGLVIGDTAINAGLIGAPTLMAAAMAAICSYVIPNLYAPSAILRFGFTIAGGLLGIWGISILFCVVFVNICSKTSFGIPFTSPVTPAGFSSFRDVFVRAGWKTLAKNPAKIQNMPGTSSPGGAVND